MHTQLLTDRQTLHCIALHYIALHYITLHCITLHYIALRYIALHYIALHYITLHTYLPAYLPTYIHTYIKIYIYKSINSIKYFLNFIHISFTLRNYNVGVSENQGDPRSPPPPSRVLPRPAASAARPREAPRASWLGVDPAKGVVMVWGWVGLPY